mmetsp:Transcript_41307/g.106963  ORF Transcript_41307/g.106963 Transcript_41307/m.106963 type:complete len:226 (+) Transcript_41307:293-970(+)
MAGAAVAEGGVASAAFPWGSGAPGAFAAWLLPGKLLVGRYPFVDCDRCWVAEEGERQLAAVLRAGVTVFCSLQAELPGQAEMPERGVRNFVPYKPSVDRMAPALAASRGKRTPACQYLSFPIPDMGAPSDETMDAALRFLSDHIHAGAKVYLHCWGGRGRAGVVAACFLMREQGLDAEDALRRVQAAYDMRHDPIPRSPETAAQLAYVRAFGRRLAAQRRSQEGG